MAIKLYEAADAVRELLEQIDPETGELPAELDQARAVVATKASAVAAWVIENDMQATAVEQHAKALMARVRAARRRSEWVRQYLGTHMAAAGITAIKSDDGLLSVKLERERDESVDVFQPEMLPREFLRMVPETYEPEKASIKLALKQGRDVPGARLVKRDRLTIK